MSSEPIIEFVEFDPHEGSNEELSEGSDKEAIEVPMQPYAGKLLLIENLVVPNEIDDEKRAAGKERRRSRKFMDMKRPSFFDRKAIERTLLKYCNLQNFKVQTPFKEELVDGLLAAVETYTKYMIKCCIALSRHRTGNAYYNNKLYEIRHDMRLTMRFLENREAEDFGGSDEEVDGPRIRWSKLKRKRPGDTVNDRETRLNLTNATALLALGARKPTVMAGIKTDGAATALPQPPRTPIVRNTNVTVKDVIRFMENNKRYSKSQLLFDAYLDYNY